MYTKFYLFSQILHLYPILCLASFSSISTRIISGPIFTILHHGINNSNSLHRQPNHLPGPGTINARIQPSHSSNSRSVTFPRHLQSDTLITSFCSNSLKRIRFYKYLYSLVKSYAPLCTFITLFFLYYTLKRNRITSPSFTT